MKETLNLFVQQYSHKLWGETQVYTIDYDKHRGRDGCKYADRLLYTPMLYAAQSDPSFRANKP